MPVGGACRKATGGTSQLSRILTGWAWASWPLSGPIQFPTHTQAFPYAPQGEDRLLRQMWEITAGRDPAEVMIALGALMRRGDRAGAQRRQGR